MADVEQDNPVIVNGNQVIVKNFLTQDYDIVSYFQNLEESDNLGQKLENALKIGIVAMKSIGVAGNVDFVEKAFDNLDSKFKQNLESAFGDDGKFSEVLKDHFGEDGKIIKDLFDPNKVGTPLHALRLDIDKIPSFTFESLPTSLLVRINSSEWTCAIQSSFSSHSSSKLNPFCGLFSITSLVAVFAVSLSLISERFWSISNRSACKGVPTLLGSNRSLIIFPSSPK